eukprot:CAMPEP_0206234504 /NCGR_PEP_ID=MMETSP0047_2-20121206/12629_1 /ASSEMBLY_ACC=CAM_ASM_000192 /TAXON_ID=195065 /ORGANISM="Chroomonas mesostigmatica_cf, Strain CCMP1168" /LENGTH=120 /DNA_ID=CAMNT_0053658601 /DNA_START=20 /DNA_END=382 /DNA_ORIENTATION=+
MIAKTVAFAALVGSASAYVAPTMMASANRRQVIQTAGAAAIAAPLLRPNGASASDPQLLAPVVTILDHRTCTRIGKEYKGELSGRAEDDQCVVKVQMQKVAVSDKTAADVLQQVLGDLKK